MMKTRKYIAVIFCRYGNGNFRGVNDDLFLEEHSPTRFTRLKMLYKTVGSGKSLRDEYVCPRSLLVTE